MQLNLGSAWETIESFLSPHIEPDIVRQDELKASVTVLEEHGLIGMISEWWLVSFRRHLQKSVTPSFWSRFKSPVQSDNVIPHMCEAFQSLCDELTPYFPCCDRLGFLQTHVSSEDLKSILCRNHLLDESLLLIKAVVFPLATIPFQNAVFDFYSKTFKAFEASPSPDGEISLGSIDESGEEATLMTCRGCERNRDECTCSATVSQFHQLNAQLRTLGLLERLSGEAVTSIIHDHIKKHIEHTCKGNFEQAYLESLEKWLECKVVGWLEVLYGSSGDEHQTTDISAHKERLYHYMYTMYAETRISELFNVIIEFPESGPALSDLKSCLEKTDLRSKLVTELKTALETRLLHPGVNTGDILTAYISAIRALRVLDPSGVLLELVCEPVRTYLRCREDTVRCIVSSLTEDSSSELCDELVKAHPLALNESGMSDVDPDNWESWTPDPVDADPGKMTVNRRSSDIISMLVNIYGSKELFVNEYRTLLADRILTHFNYGTEKEIRYLELLKLRFGESQLHYCEVMLKDVADSKRINSHIVEQRRKKKAAEGKTDDADKVLPVNAMILSAEFWPTFREEKLELPDSLNEALETYTKSFEALKGNRTLNWKTHLGLVNIEVELKDRTLDLHVSPVYATILWHYQNRSEWTVEELSSVMHMPAVTLRRKMAFWQSHGLLREDKPDTFVLVEEQRGRSHDVVMVEEDETESAMASASDQREEDMQILWSYIVGMITNLESLPLERIHTMLKMFAMQGPSSECSQAELKAFLDRKVKEQKLVYSTGVYRLPKHGS